MRGIIFIALAALAATACDAEQQSANNIAEEALNAAADAAEPPVEGRPVELRSETPLISWAASWPAEVNAIPALERLIREPAEKALAEYTRDARKQKAERDKERFDFNPYMYESVVEVAGQTPRLLSIIRSWSEHSGGAHPNRFTEELLWDKQANALVPVAKLLQQATLDSLYRVRFCKALEAERAERREGEPLDMFNECPKFADLKIVPKGPEKGGPMSTLLFHADPYVAGPYVEGEYDIELPVDAAFVAALKPEYRSSFAAR